MNSSKKCIFVEGNVGAGKTTLLNLLEQETGFQIFYEPHELWQDVGGHNLLEQFFLDQKRWSLTLQSYVTVTQIQQLNQAYADSQAIKLFERSVYAGRYCFAPNLYEMGFLNDLEWGVYQKMWEFDTRDVILPSGFIYLRVPAETCLQRIQKRKRFEERSISLEYIRNLEKKHDDWLLDKKNIPENIQLVSTLVLDDVGNVHEDKNLQQAYVQKVKQFIQQIS